jgi:hypothetical protein
VMRLHAGIGAVAEKNLNACDLGVAGARENGRHLDAFCVASSRCVHVQLLHFFFMQKDGEIYMRGVLPLPVVASTLTPPSSNATSTSR